jgi:hypothetical protein
MGTVTAADIRQALLNAYRAPEWYLAFEVGNATGSACRRYADAVAVNAYPSKGHETRGFEIKVSKQDLAAELRDGEKSDAIARYCDYWFLVVPKGLADSATLPPTWGVLEYADGKLHCKVRATRLERGPVTHGFLCAMLRGRERTIAEETSKRVKEDVMRNTQGAGKELDVLRQKLAEVKAVTGIDLSKWTPSCEIIQQFKEAQMLKIVPRYIRGIKRMAETMVTDAAAIQKAMAEMQSEAVNK